ncbi:hypothetical protein QTG56_24785 (plasmid) [Rossellomorea sp. AcN35-11]|nr:hypothetical protein [Rossellomorea aquimaris]WJV31852.1 hypothetical protein QTG56_24785 [Rossellomorea sp. AcN35-11]
MPNYIEVDGNWKKFYDAKPSEELLLLHATSLENAKKICKNDFLPKNRNWEDSEEGYVYLAGSRYNLGTYLRYTENAIIRILVRKELLLPDNNSVDWKEYVKFNRDELKKDKVNIKEPTSFDTFKHIGQVKARIEDITIIDFYKT